MKLRCATCAYAPQLDPVTIFTEGFSLSSTSAKVRIRWAIAETVK